MIERFASILIAVAFACPALAYAQQEQTLSGDFDDDELTDSLSYHFTNDPKDGPVIACHMRRGNGQVMEFTIGTATSSMRINDCGKGCLETYVWITGADGSEEYEQYVYNKTANNWLLSKTMTFYPNGKKKVVVAREAVGIDGQNYPPSFLPAEPAKKASGKAKASDKAKKASGK